MMRVFYPELLAGTLHEERALDLASRTYEFGEFLVDRLRTETGIDFGGLTAFSPVGEDGRPDIVLPPPQPDAALADD